jgi:hypothetical protein
MISKLAAINYFYDIPFIPFICAWIFFLERRKNIFMQAFGSKTDS